MTLHSGGQAPYAPPSAVTEILRRFRDRGLTTPITKEVIERAGVADTLSRRTVQALKLLGFIDADGMPSEELLAMSRAPEAQYKEMLGEFISGAYGDVFQFADPATDTYDRVRDAFRAFDPKGQQDRMVTLFLGLLDYAGIDTSAASASRRTESAGSSQRPVVGKAAKAAKATSSRPKPDPVGSRASVEHALPPGLLGLLQQIPQGGRGWTQPDRDNFVRAFTAVLDFTVPVRPEVLEDLADADIAEAEAEESL